MKRTMIGTIVVLTASLFAVGLVRGRDQHPAADCSNNSANSSDEEQNRWMQAKLSGSQEILAGLTNGDLETVAVNARLMEGMNFLERWTSDNGFAQKSEYRGQLNAFEYANKELIRNADDGNMDGALDAYMQMTRTCVQCHKLIRDVGPDK